eukprot:4973979-Amphidinium_carterae.1
MGLGCALVLRKILRSLHLGLVLPDEYLGKAAQNYPDVSFASSSLVYGLVTTSLKHNFAPSILRTQDKICTQMPYLPWPHTAQKVLVLDKLWRTIWYPDGNPPSAL